MRVKSKRVNYLNILSLKKKGVHSILGVWGAVTLFICVAYPVAGGIVFSLSAFSSVYAGIVLSLRHALFFAAFNCLSILPVSFYIPI